MNRPRKANRHLPPCVYEKHGAFWYVKGKKWTRLGTDLHAALEKYATLFQSPKGGIVELIDQTLPAITRDAKPNTARQYRAAAKILKKAMVEFSPEQVKQKHAAAIRLSLAATPAMANTVLSVAKLLFNQWLEEQLIDANPFTGIRRFKVKKRERLISGAEYDAIYAEAGDRLQVIMDLWRLTGQRVVDVLRIRRADLLDEGIAFRQQKTDTRLVVRWTAELRAVTDRAKGLYGNLIALTLLHNQRGKALSYHTILKQWRAACTAAGVEDAQQRDLRAMSATETKRQGKDATALLGHQDSRTTRIYLRGREAALVDGPSFRQSETVLDATIKKG